MGIHGYINNVKVVCILGMLLIASAQAMGKGKQSTLNSKTIISYDQVIRKAATKGDRDAYYLLGQQYEKGLNGTQDVS